MKKVVFFLFFAFFLFSFSYAKTVKVPRFALKSETGQIVKKDHIKGKPTVLVFWTLNCSSCKKELPILNEYYHRLKDKVNFFAVVLFTKNLEKVKQRKKQWGFDIPVLFGDSNTAYKFRTPFVPTLYFINKDLTVFKVVYGKRSKEELQKLFEEFLKKNLE